MNIYKRHCHYDQWRFDGWNETLQDNIVEIQMQKKRRGKKISLLNYLDIFLEHQSSMNLQLLQWVHILIHYHTVHIYWTVLHKIDHQVWHIPCSKHRHHPLHHLDRTESGTSPVRRCHTTGLSPSRPEKEILLFSSSLLMVHRSYVAKDIKLSKMIPQECMPGVSNELAVSSGPNFKKYIESSSHSHQLVNIPYSSTY